MLGYGREGCKMIIHRLTTFETKDLGAKQKTKKYASSNARGCSHVETMGLNELDCEMAAPVSMSTDYFER
jgi:hypothetical protein